MDENGNLNLLSKDWYSKTSGWALSGQPIVATGYPKKIGAADGEVFKEFAGMDKYSALNLNNGTVLIIVENNTIYELFNNTVTGNKYTAEMLGFTATTKGTFTRYADMVQVDLEGHGNMTLVSGTQLHCPQSSGNCSDEEQKPRTGVQMFDGLTGKSMSAFKVCQTFAGIEIISQDEASFTALVFNQFIGNRMTYNPKLEMSMTGQMDLRYGSKAPFTNNVYFDCPEHFCISSTIDAAAHTSIGGHATLITRGEHYWYLNSWPPKNQLYPSKAISIKDDLKHPGHLDAAFTIQITYTTYFIRDKTYVTMIPDRDKVDGGWQQAGPFPLSDIIGTSLNLPSATYFHQANETLFVFSGDMVDMYLFKDNKFAKLGVTKDIANYNGLPANMDAALYLSSNESYFFKGNYHYKFDTDRFDKGGPFVPVLSQGNLIECPASFYDNYRAFGQSLGVADYNSFVKYIGAFLPQTPKPIVRQATTIPIETTTLKPNGPAASKAAVRSDTLAIVLIVIGGVLVLAAVAVITFFLTYRKPKRGWGSKSNSNSDPRWDTESKSLSNPGLPVKDTETT